jgi:hypothetical protein
MGDGPVIAIRLTRSQDRNQLMLRKLQTTRSDRGRFVSEVFIHTGMNAFHFY